VPGGEVGYARGVWTTELGQYRQLLRDGEFVSHVALLLRGGQHRLEEGGFGYPERRRERRVDGVDGGGRGVDVIDGRRGRRGWWRRRRRRRRRNGQCTGVTALVIRRRQYHELLFSSFAFV
jgi:hypothetical protein